MNTRRTRRVSAVAAAVAATLSIGALPPASAGAGAPAHTTHGRQPARTLIPIGGGYETDTLRQLVQQTARVARGRTVDILVVPSSYGDAPEDREENLRQAGTRASQINAVCESTISSARFEGCRTTLLPLLNRQDALNPANSRLFDDRETDAGFVLGGDQVLAMQVLANSPAEAAMTRAHGRGVVISGTSAGNAVESRSMITGYSPDGTAATGLQRDAVTVGWGDDLRSDDRGLAFGSRRFVFDQHFYQRGRFGRLLNVTAQSAERYGHGGKIGMGADYATAPVLKNDRVITDVIGPSSTALVDLRTGRATTRWVGADQTLSSRNVLTHLLAPGLGLSYDAATRTVASHGRRLVGRPQSLPSLTAPGRGTVLLGGGDNDRADSPVLRSFVSALPRSGGPVVVLLAGYPDAAAADAAGASYRAALTGAGWSGPVRVLVAGRDRIEAGSVRSAAGVLAVGGDASLLGPALQQGGLPGALRDAARNAPALLTDGALTAAMGSRYATVARPTSDNYEDEGIRSFRADAQTSAPGLGLVRGVNLEPRLTDDYRWGFLYGAAARDRRTIPLGISETTAIRLDRRGAGVVGDRSVVSLDGRSARFGTGSNGAIAAVGVWVNTYAAGDRVLR